MGGDPTAQNQSKALGEAFKILLKNPGGTPGHEKFYAGPIRAFEHMIYCDEKPFFPMGKN